MNIANTTFPHVSACASKDIAFLSCTMLHGNSGTHRNAFLSTQLHSSEFNRFRLSCPGISGDAAFLFGSAVECHLELLNFACSVRNGISYATQAAKWTLHGHCIRFSAGSPTHFDRDRKDATWRGCGMIFQPDGFDSDLCRTITNYGLA